MAVYEIFFPKEEGGQDIKLLTEKVKEISTKIVSVDLDGVYVEEKKELLLGTYTNGVLFTYIPVSEDDFLENVFLNHLIFTFTTGDNLPMSIVKDDTPLGMETLNEVSLSVVQFVIENPEKFPGMAGFVKQAELIKRKLRELPTPSKKTLH